MLIALTGQPGHGQSLVCDFLMHAHTFIPTSFITDDLVDQALAEGHNALVLDVSSEAEAQAVYERGGIILHVRDPKAPDFGPMNGISLRDIDRTIDASHGNFDVFDTLDRIVDDAAYAGVAA